MSRLHLIRWKPEQGRRSFYLFAFIIIILKSIGTALSNSFHLLIVVQHSVAYQFINLFICCWKLRLFSAWEYYEQSCYEHLYTSKNKIKQHRLSPEKRILPTNRRWPIKIPVFPRVCGLTAYRAESAILPGLMISYLHLNIDLPPSFLPLPLPLQLPFPLPNTLGAISLFHSLCFSGNPPIKFPFSAKEKHSLLVQRKH